MATCGSWQMNDCEDCVQVVRNTKTVQVPCTVNTYQKYTVKVPRQVTEKVPRKVVYTDYETRSKQVPYTVNRSEKRIRTETQSYQVPVTKYYKTTVMETKERQVPVPYYVQVPETKYRTVTEQVPVQKSKIEMDSVVKTVYDTQIKTRCVPKTTMVSKQIPVFNVVARPAPPCPPENSGADAINEHKENDVIAFNAADVNNDGMLSYEEYANARANGTLPEPVTTWQNQSYRE